MTQFFTYRDAPFQNFLYKERWKPSADQIAIIKIDDNTLNDLQARSDRSMLTIGKKTYIELVKKLESVGVKGIAFDIIFQNTDPDEDLFASVLEHYRNTVIGVGSRCIPSDFPVAKLPKSSKTYVSCDGRYEGSELQQMFDASGGYIFPECIQDESGSTYTCDSFPRSVYT